MNKSLTQYKGVTGYFPIANGNFHFEYFPVEDLEQADGYIKSHRKQDTYATICTFKSVGSATKGNIDKVTAHFIDIDSHIAKADEEEILKAWQIIYEECLKGVIPYPNLVQNSGRGLHIFYYLKGGATDTTLWEYTQRALNEKIESIVQNFSLFYGTENNLSIDKAVCNANRLARVNGTYNSKAKAYVKTLYTSPKRYTQAEIINGFSLVFKDTKTNKPIDIKGLNSEELLKATTKELKAFRTWGTYTTDYIRNARLRDLISLIHIRNARNITTGYRKNLLHISSFLIKEKKPTAEMLCNEIEQINNAFEEPLSSAEIEETLYFTWRHPQRYFATNKIIEMLNITEQEQEMLTIIANARIKQRWRNNRHYEPIKQANEEQRYKAIKKALELKAQGYSTREIASIMKTAQTNIVRWQKNGEK